MDKTKFEASQIFMYNVNRIWTILKDQQKVYQLLSQKACVSETNGDFSQTEDKDGVIPTRRNQRELHDISLSIKELITNSFFKQIAYVMKNTATKMAVLLKFVLYPNTLDNSTLTILEISSLEDSACKEEDNTPIVNNDMFNKDFVNEFLEQFNEYLKVSSEYLNEYQSILINCSYKFLLEFLLSTRELRRILNCSPLNYPGEHLKINKCEKEKGRNQWFIIFELYNKEYDQILTQIKFSLLMINEQCTFLTFHHDFRASIEQHQLNSLANNKKEFLFELKRYCEEHIAMSDHV